MKEGTERSMRAPYGDVSSLGSRTKSDGVRSDPIDLCPAEITRNFRILIIVHFRVYYLLASLFKYFP
jgi:hypothetical protein